MFSALYMEEKWPPIPTEGDYRWGMDATPITFPFSGNGHQAGEMKMEITLVPVNY